MPAGEIEEAVHANQVIERDAGHPLAQFGKDMDGIVWQAIKAGGVKTRWGKAGVGGARQGCHCEAVGETCSRARRFERLDAGGREQNRIQGELVRGCSSDGEMAAMNGVKGATEESYAHS